MYNTPQTHQALQAARLKAYAGGQTERVSEMEIGTVRFFNSRPEKRFGFITADSGENVFFHHNNNTDDTNRTPKKGDQVEFVLTHSTKGLKALEWNYDPYILFGDVSRTRLGKQAQYGVDYVTGHTPKEHESSCIIPRMSEGLRFRGNPSDYHSLFIHKNDVEIFVERVQRWKEVQCAFREDVFVYINEEEALYFFSTTKEQPGVPEGFALTTYELPHVVVPGPGLLYIIATRADVVIVYLSTKKEVPNPQPEYQPTETN